MLAGRTNLTEETLFERAKLLRSPKERDQFVEEQCANDPQLRAKLHGLLCAYDDAQSLNFLSSDAPRASANRPDPLPIIPDFKIIQLVGEGGCGVVYAAEQLHPIRRRVAIKIIKAGMHTASVIARFEAERQALALMDHPNIAKVFDAGSTDTGRPYFVMELVQGQKITDYCAEQRLSINERLHLFLQVCDAVQHAHQKGIIHRDLKPSNILVSTKNSARTAQVIDFGIAKAIQGKLTEETIHTIQHQFLGTPAYMSPEQADLSPDIDTRTDIYSLGVLLYEVLTGRPPFDNHELLTAGLNEMRRIIREVEPKAPSQVPDLIPDRQVEADVRTLKDSKHPFCTSHSAIDPDLDCIILKCLEKERARRYETANALAMDIQRHLKNEVVTARPPSVGYQLQKFIRRHKLQFAAVCGMGLMLIGGVIATSWQDIRARRAEGEQRLERTRAENRLNAAIRFFDTAFNSVSPALSDVIGAARPRELLASAAAETLDGLQQTETPDIASQKVLGQLYLQLALCHGWFPGNTTGDFETAFNAATNAIQRFETAAVVSYSDDVLTRLYYAEQAAGIICMGLLKQQEAIAHFEKSRRWAERLGKLTTNSFERNQSLTMEGWAAGNMGEALLHLGRSEEALTNIFLPQLERVRQRCKVNQSSDVWDLWGLSMFGHNVALAYQKLERPRDALPFAREALNTLELLNRRRPHSAQFSSALALLRAELGEVQLCVNQPEEGLCSLEGSARLADELADRDPANAGFSQVQIEVSWHSAAGYAAWSTDISVSVGDRRRRLAEAQTHLDRAHTLLARLKSESLRRYLEADVRLVAKRIEKAGLSLEKPESAP
jgi:serine/threonine protein kinase/tetratricopeptide (TPR) repeat protein